MTRKLTSSPASLGRNLTALTWAVWPLTMWVIPRVSWVGDGEHFWSVSCAFPSWEMTYSRVPEADIRVGAKGNGTRVPPVGRRGISVCARRQVAAGDDGFGHDFRSSCAKMTFQMTPTLSMKGQRRMSVSPDSVAPSDWLVAGEARF